MGWLPWTKSSETIPELLTQSHGTVDKRLKQWKAYIIMNLANPWLRIGHFEQVAKSHCIFSHMANVFVNTSGLCLVAPPFPVVSCLKILLLLLDYMQTTLLHIGLFTQLMTLKNYKRMNTLHQWTTDWFMLFNILKCEHLTISNKWLPLSSEYKIDNIVINNVASAKYLGVTIIQNLSWKEHISKISNKANSIRGFL